MIDISPRFLYGRRDPIPAKLQGCQIIGTAAALLGVGIASAVGGVASGVIGSKAASKAAEEQSNATKYAADIQKQASDEALAFQKEQYQQQRTDLAPWRQTGTAALGRLNELMAPGGALSTPFSFNGQDFTGDPGYQFRIKQGQDAIERSAAAKGMSLGAGTQKALARYTEEFASGEYDKAYNRAFNTFQANNTNLFNRYASLSGIGQQAVTQLGQEGSQLSRDVANNLLGTSRSLADYATQGANARASGYIGGANAWTGALSGLANTGNSLAAYNLISNNLPKQRSIYQQPIGPQQLPGYNDPGYTNPFSFDDLNV